MKKIFIALMLFFTPAIFAELIYNATTFTYYSKNAPKEVDQQEYNILAKSFFSGSGPVSRHLGFNYVPAHEFALFFTMLRMNGSPAALRLLYDVELIIKNTAKELQRINNL